MASAFTPGELAPGPTAEPTNRPRGVGSPGQAGRRRSSANAGPAGDFCSARVLRRVRFVGLRDDKDPRTVALEVAEGF